MGQRDHRVRGFLNRGGLDQKLPIVQMALMEAKAEERQRTTTPPISTSPITIPIAGQFIFEFPQASQPSRVLRGWIVNREGRHIRPGGLFVSGPVGYRRYASIFVTTPHASA